MEAQICQFLSLMVCIDHGASERAGTHSEILGTADGLKGG